MDEWWDDPEIQNAMKVLKDKGLTFELVAEARHWLEQQKEPNNV